MVEPPRNLIKVYQREIITLYLNVPIMELAFKYHVWFLFAMSATTLVMFLSIIMFGVKDSERA